jgi:hypothetical protein
MNIASDSERVKGRQVLAASQEEQRGGEALARPTPNEREPDRRPGVPPREGERHAEEKLGRVASRDQAAQGQAGSLRGPVQELEHGCRAATATTTATDKLNGQAVGHREWPTAKEKHQRSCSYIYLNENMLCIIYIYKIYYII